VTDFMTCPFFLFACGSRSCVPNSLNPIRKKTKSLIHPFGRWKYDISGRMRRVAAISHAHKSEISNCAMKALNFPTPRVLSDLKLWLGPFVHVRNFILTRGESTGFVISSRSFLTWKICLNLHQASVKVKPPLNLWFVSGLSVVAGLNKVHVFLGLELRN
jgi:hypothetical protein